MLPVLKDHGSAGVTGALKNMSHGSVNNVARSHSHARHQRLQQVHPRGRQPPDPPQEVRPPDHGRHPGRLPEGPVRQQPRVRLGVQRPPLRDRPGGDGPRRVADHRRQAQGAGPAPGRRRPASSRSTRSAPRGSTSASPSTSPWPPTSAWGSSTSSRPGAGGSRSTTGSSTSPEPAPGIARGGGTGDDAQPLPHRPLRRPRRPADRAAARGSAGGSPRPWRPTGPTPRS